MYLAKETCLSISMIHYHEIVIHYDMYTVHTCHYKNKEITVFRTVVTKNMGSVFFFFLWQHLQLF